MSQQLECYIKDLENGRFLFNTTQNISLNNIEYNNKPIEYLLRNVTESTPSTFEIIVKVRINAADTVFGDSLKIICCSVKRGAIYGMSP